MDYTGGIIISDVSLFLETEILIRIVASRSGLFQNATSSIGISQNFDDDRVLCFMKQLTSTIPFISTIS